MTPGDALAELDRTGALPSVPAKPKKLYTTTERLLPPANYIIAVASTGISRNMQLSDKKDHMS